MTIMPVQDTKLTSVQTTTTDVALDYASGAAPRGLSTVIRLYHTGAAEVFIRFGTGTDTVTLTNGIPLAPKDEYQFTKPKAATKLMAIAAAISPLYTTECLY